MKEAGEESYDQDFIQVLWVTNCFNRYLLNMVSRYTSNSLWNDL